MAPVIDPVKTVEDFDAEGNPMVCGLCSRDGDMCCRCKKGEEELLPPLSDLELNKMEAALTPELFRSAVTEATNTLLFLKQVRRLFLDGGADVQRVFPSDGTHRRLSIHDNGYCTLLGPDGCFLPKEARPFICRLYPFWFTGHRLQVFQNPGCLALNQSRTVSGLCQQLGTTPDELKILHGKLRQAWGFHRQS